MVDLGQVKWRKLLGFAIVVIVAAIVGYVLPSPMWANSPGRVLVRVAIIAAGFGILPVVYRIWPPSGRGHMSTRRWVVFFALLVVAMLALGFFGSNLISWLDQAGFGGAFEAWGGWLLPLVFLAVFLAFVLLRRRRAP